MTVAQLNPKEGTATRSAPRPRARTKQEKVIPIAPAAKQAPKEEKGFWGRMMDRFR